MEPGVDLDVLVADWTLLDDEWPLVARKRGGSRLVFALLLKSYGRHGRFLSGPETVSAEIVDFVARRVGVSASSLAGPTSALSGEAGRSAARPQTWRCRTWTTNTGRSASSPGRCARLA